MEIYREENKNAFNSFLTTNSKVEGNRRRILSTLPLHTISKELLLKILKRNKIEKENIEKILQFVEFEKNITETILASNFIVDEISETSRDSFKKDSLTLSLSNNFYADKIFYNYNEYLEHLDLTKKYSKNNSNYSLNTSSSNVFKNIQITIHEGKVVIISKNTDPTIHFVIKHSKLRKSIENFVAPITD